MTEKLDDFIEGKVIKEERLGFTEPDFVFTLHPVESEDGINDIKMDICISLWESNMRLSGEKVEFSVYREDIEKFRDYLKQVMDNSVEGDNIIGPFSTIQELMDELNS